MKVLTYEYSDETGSQYAVEWFDVCTDKLDSCPSCGGMDLYVWDLTDEAEQAQAECGSCEMRGPVAATVELAGQAWNAMSRGRAAPPGPAAAPEEDSNG